MKTHDLIQGSPEWLAYRKTHFNASDATAMLGISPYKTRSQLLHELHTGISPEVDAATQRRFDAGHAAEAAARPLAEEIIGAELYPVTGSEGKISASFDGLTMDESTVWEHKLMNAELSASLPGGFIPEQYHPQLEQQLMVSGANKALFMASSSDGATEAHVWYASRPELRTAILQGWTQFAIDLAAYVPTEVIMPAVAAPQMNLPAVSIQVNGSIALVDNLQAFGTALTAYVARINKSPETDQDFADLEATVKTLKNAEEALDAAENGALAQTESIDNMRRTVGLYRETARTNRLLVEKLVKVEKENRRTKIISDAGAAFAAHMNSLNTRLGKAYMPQISADFNGVVKGLKSMDSMLDKVNGELARAKIEANAVADKIQVNLTTLRELASAHAFLFADTASLVLKDTDTVENIVKIRIMDHKEAELAKEEATRERIRKEEVERLAREQEERERNEANARAKAAAEAEKNALDAMTLATAPPCHQTVVVPSQASALSDKPIADRNAAAFIDRIEAKQTPPTMSLGSISERLGFNVTSAFLASLGFEATTVKASKLYHEADFPRICRALVDHIESVCEVAA